MKNFDLHNVESAAEEAKPLLQNSINTFGMIPNLHAVMAESPQLLEGYQRLHSLAQNTSFNADELTVVWQSINVEHNCHYCVPAHTAIAKGMKVNDDITDALRNQSTLPTTKLEVLRDTTLFIVRERGVIDDATVQRFIEAGFTRQNLLEIILILSQKVMSNYVNHLADTPIDEAFQPFSWQKA